MTERGTISLREANQDFSRLVERVTRTDQGGVVTKRGVPIVRTPPVEKSAGGLIPDQQALLDHVLGDKLPMAPWEFDRDELYDR